MIRHGRVSCAVCYFSSQSCFEFDILRFSAILVAMQVCWIVISNKNTASR